MANINSLTSNSYSSSSSVYGNRNVLTGLASGMDTETMIENSVAGYQTKITELQQKQTKLQWKQDAYRELVDQMYHITNKYTSFTSETNLSSNAFFSNNVSTVANGNNASMAAAVGRATSDIRINAVDKLATAARYTVDISSLGIKGSDVAVGQAIDWDKHLTKGTLSGTMTLKLGGSSVELRFTDEDKYASLDELLNGINKKLDEQGANAKATLEDGEITFEATGSAKDKGDSVYISGAGGNLKTMLDVTTPSSGADENRFNYNSFSVKDGESSLTEDMSMAQYLSGKSVEVTLDGETKTVTIGDLSGTTQEELGTALEDSLQASVDKKFGTNKITVGFTDGALRFDVADGSQIKVTSAAGKELGIGESGASNYFNAGRKLGELLSEDALRSARVAVQTADITSEERHFDKDGNELKEEDGTFYRVDSKGQFVLKDGEKVEGWKVHTFNVDTEGRLVSNYMNESDQHYLVNEKGDYLYDLKINGTTIGDITKETSLESVLSKINSSNDAGVKVSYSNLTEQFVFTSQKTGAGSDITFDGALAQELFGVKDRPTNTTLESLFGDTLSWDEDGNAMIVALGVPDGSASIGTFNKNDTVDKFMKELDQAGGGALKDWLSYDASAGEYSLGAGYDSAHPGRVSLMTLNGGMISMEQLAERANAAKASLGSSKTAGQDAVIRATVNGKDLELTRSSNVVNMDGLTVTFKDTFSAYDERGKVNTADALTFTTSSNSDKIVETIKSFVEDVNKLMSSVHSAYTTQPVVKTSASSKKGITYYEPLTEEDRKDMSESAVTKYEEKAKTGLLFGDSDLRTLYDKLLTSIQAYGSDRVDLESIGLTTAYSDGVTTLKLNESKLRAALDGDADKVKNVFTKTKDYGSATDGLMATLKRTLNDYASTSLATPGVLVRKAGTKLSAVSLLNNNIYSQISNLDQQIESWQTKLSNRIDYYTKQFTALEKMMSTMNNQSSMLADLMGY